MQEITRGKEILTSFNSKDIQQLRYGQSPRDECVTFQSKILWQGEVQDKMEWMYFSLFFLVSAANYPGHYT